MDPDYEQLAGSLGLLIAFSRGDDEAAKEMRQSTGLSANQLIEGLSALALTFAREVANHYQTDTDTILQQFALSLGQFADGPPPEDEDAHEAEGE